ncbi:uncharacterized protein LOC144874716 isoform X1 [Branchiostoma floridae x Branchiostoma japonicum]
MQGQGDIPAYGPSQPVLPGRERLAFPLDSYGPRSGVLLGFGGADAPSFPMDGHSLPGFPPNRDQLYGTAAMPNFSMLQTMNKGGRGDAAISLPYVNGKENQEPLDNTTEGVMRQHAWNKSEPGGQMIESSVQSSHSVGGQGLEGGPLPLSQKGSVRGRAPLITDADMMEHVRAKQHAHLMSHMHQLQAWQREQQEQLLRQQMEQLARIRQEQEKMKSLLVAQRTGHWGGEVKAPSSPKQRSPSRSKSGASPTGSRQPLSPSHRPWSTRSPPRAGPGSSPGRARSTLPDALARASMSPRRLAQSFLPQDDLPQAPESHDHMRQSRMEAPVPAPTDSDLGSVMDDGQPLEMEGVFPLPETASEMEDDQSVDHAQEQGNETDSRGNTTPPSSLPKDSRSNSSQGSGTPEDERPIKPLSAGRPKTFEQLLEEKLHLEESKKDSENVDGPKQKATKRPFLRKGQGLARFGLTQNRTAGKTPPSEDVQETRHTNQTGRSTTQREKAPSINDKVSSQKPSAHSTPPTSSSVRQPKRLITTLKLRPQPVRKSVAVTKEKVAPQPTVAKQPLDNGDAPPVENTRQEMEDEGRTADANGSPTSVASWDMSFQVRLQELEQKEQLEDEELKEFEMLERMAANMSSFMGSTPAKANMSRSQGPSGSLRQPVRSDDEGHEMNEDDVQLEQTLEEEDSDLDCTIREQPEGEDWGQDEEQESKTDSPHGVAVLPETAEGLQDKKDMEKEDDRDSESDRDDAAAVSSQALNVDFDDDDSWGDISNKGLEEDDHDTTLDDSIVAGARPLDTSTPPAKANRLGGFSTREQSSPRSDEAPAPVSVEPPPTSELVAKLFPKLKPSKPKVSAEQEEQQQKLHTAAEKSVGEGFQSKVLRDKLAQLETEIERFRQENTALAKLRADREEGMQRLQQEMTEFEKLKSDELKRLEEFRQQEAAKLKKERKLFEQHKKALLQPDKKERAEIEELREQVQELQDELQRREQRWQSSLNRLKNQLQAAQNESQELREELRMMEKQRLDAWSKADTKKKDHAPAKAFHKQKVRKEISPEKDEETKSSEDSDKSPEMPAPPKSQLQSQKDRKEKRTGHFPQDEWDSDSVPEETPRKIPIAAALEQHPSGVKTSDGPKPRRPLQRKKAVKFAGDEDLSLEEEDADAVEHLQHGDGKTENVLKDGRRVITFSNGTRKEISADGQMLIVTFCNGDIKQIMPDQRVIYYYAEAQTTHTTYPDGLEILQFPNSQMEKHYPDGTKEITFPDQTIKYLFPNGDEESIFQDGTVLRVSKSGDRVVEFANGQREIHTLNYKKREYPDGTVKTVYPDGKQETRYSNGRIRVKDKDGNIVVDKRM